MIDLEKLSKFATTYTFAFDIKMHRQGDGRWFVSDRNGFRLGDDGIFIGCPSPQFIGNWIDNTSFTFEDALKALSRRHEVHQQLASFVTRAADEPAS